MALRVCFPAVFFWTTALLFSQENPARLSVAAPSPSPAPATSSPATSNPQPATTALPATQTSPATNSPATSNPPPAPTGSGPATNLSPEGSNLTDAPLPEVANQPKVIPPGQTQTADGPKGPRDGHWYFGASAGVTLQQFQMNGTATAQSQTPLEVGPNDQLGWVITGKAGYEFAIRDVQMAFGTPIPIRTAMEFDFTYIGYREKAFLNPTDGPKIGTENSQITCWVPCINGIVKFEELPVIPYFGGGIGAGIIYSNNHQIVVTQTTSNSGTYSTSISNASNVSLALQAIVGLEVPINRSLDFFIEYKFLALMNVELAYGSTPTNSSLNPQGPSQGGGSSTNDFLAQQLISAGLKWSF